MPEVLIVEDDEILREIYSVKFGMEGFSVRVAGDGVDGLTAADAQRPDLILLDMLMPRLGGLDFLRRYAAAHKDSKAKILVASNKSNADTRAEALSLGACEYIVKSQVTPQEIVQHARRHLEP